VSAPVPRVGSTGQAALGPDISETGAILAAFGGTLKSRRIRAGLTQEALAHRCFLRTDQVSRFERGRSEPHLTVLLALARGVNATAGELVATLAAPTREASQRQMLSSIAATHGISIVELAPVLELPRWYINQNARSMQSRGWIRWDRSGWHARNAIE
jgi:transcriptional regulator with XRE-family HTH domain